jgi:diguanylate cyclase (GGDEF)-like protein
VRHFWTLILLCLAFAAVARAEPVYDLKVLGNNASLGTSRGTITAVQSAISVEVPSGKDQVQSLDLDAVGNGPEFYWSLYTLTNSTAVARDSFFVFPHRAFPGSGLFQPAPTGTLVLNAVQKSGDKPTAKGLIPLRGPAEDVFPVHLESGQTQTFAFQGVEPLPDAELWAVEAYGKRQSQLTGLQGAIAGIAALLTLGFFVLAATRRAAIAVSCFAFALTALLFILHELGFLQAMLGLPLPLGVSQNTLRAIVETLLFGGFVAALAGLRSVTRYQQRTLFYSACFGGVLGAANIIFSFFNAPVAMGFARIAIVFVAIEGVVLLYRAQRAKTPIAISALPLWLFGVAWVAFAGYACFAWRLLPQLSMFMLLGLCGVLAATGYVLLQNLFERIDIDADIAASSTERSSLALASADHFVWEWRPQHERITIDQELSRQLGYRGPDLENTAQLHFFQRVHPEDLQDLLEQSGEVAAGTARLIECELRLNSADGSYRWFSLKARAHVDEVLGDLVCLGTLTDITKSKVIEHRLQEDAVHDPVSGLPSRALFLDRLQRSLANRAAPPVRVLILDVDRFKTFNDGYGPDIGDHLLMIMARRIQDQLGPEDSATRLTGSQFAIVFNEPAHGHEDAYARALMLSLQAPIVLSNQEVVLSVSGGLSMRGLPGVPADELLAQATNALHSAKTQGLGALAVYDYGMRNERIAQVALESDLRLAITRGEIEVHYQPIVSLTDGKTAGFEALARWRHPKLGLVAPEQFIKAAEEAGLISEIGAIIMAEAARQLGIWQRTIARNRKVFVTVNASASQLLEKEFLQTIQHIMQREVLNPGSLKIEVTEAVVMRYSDRILTLFGTLRQLGVGLACDDFGTGFSSLSTLRNLPFDTLKLDRSFISTGKDQDRAAHVIRTVLDLAHGLGMTVVCEGVESLDQVERLTEMGCDYGQGYHFGAAAVAKQVEDLIGIAPISAPDPYRPPSLAEAALATITAASAPANVPEELPSIYAVANPDAPPLPPSAGPVLTLTPQRKPRAQKKKASKRAKKKS